MNTLHNLIIILIYLAVLFVLFNVKYFYLKNPLQYIIYIKLHMIGAPFIVLFVFIFGISLYYWIYFIIFSLLTIIFIIDKFEDIRKMRIKKNYRKISFILFLILFLSLMVGMAIKNNPSASFLVYLMGDLSWFTDSFNMILNDSGTKTIIAFIFVGALGYIVGVTTINSNMVGYSRYLIYGTPAVSLMNNVFSETLRETVSESTLNSIMQDVILTLFIYILIQIIFYLLIITIVEKFLSLLKET